MRSRASTPQAAAHGGDGSMDVLSATQIGPNTLRGWQLQPDPTPLTAVVPTAS